MAVGVVYAGYLSGSAEITAGGALALSLGIAIQNFPEGAIISMERQAKREMIEAFLRDLAEMDEDVQEFTDDLWFNLLDHVTVFSKKDVRFTFKNGTEIHVR